MTTNYIALRDHLEDRLTQFGRELSGPMAGFARLHKKAVEDGALSGKIKELMALAIGVAIGCEGCIAYHTHDTIKAGATRAELLETIGVGVMMAGLARFTLRMRWMRSNNSCLLNNLRPRLLPDLCPIPTRPEEKRYDSSQTSDLCRSGRTRAIDFAAGSGAAIWPAARRESAPRSGR